MIYLDGIATQQPSTLLPSTPLLPPYTTKAWLHPRPPSLCEDNSKRLVLYIHTLIMLWAAVILGALHMSASVEETSSSYDIRTALWWFLHDSLRTVFFSRGVGEIAVRRLLTLWRRNYFFKF